MDVIDRRRAEWLRNNNSLHISNAALGDVVFINDTGSWNVTRALRHCLAGMHRGWMIGLEDYLAKNVNIEVEPEKIAAMVADSNFLTNYPPLIGIVRNSMLWVIDGHHRARALLLLGQTEARAWVIEEADSEPYKVYYNGKHVAPWMENL